MVGTLSADLSVSKPLSRVMRIFRWEADHSMDINLDDSNLDRMQSHIWVQLTFKMQVNASNFNGIYFSSLYFWQAAGVTSCSLGWSIDFLVLSEEVIFSFLYEDL